MHTASSPVSRAATSHRRASPAKITATGHLIERGLPIPKQKRASGAGRPILLSFDDMLVGDSVFLKAGTRPAVSRARSNAFNAAKRAEIKVTVRSVSGGLRVWRVA